MVSEINMSTRFPFLLSIACVAFVVGSLAAHENVEKILKEKSLLKGESLYDPENVGIVHHINQAIRANKLFERDKDYIAVSYTHLTLPTNREV